jgi:hypothetical protein
MPAQVVLPRRGLRLALLVAWGLGMAAFAAAPQTPEGRWEADAEAAEEARRDVDRALRRVRPLLGPAGARGGRPRGDGSDRRGANPLFEGLAVPQTAVEIERDGDAWVVAIDDLEPRRITASAVVSRQNPIVRIGGLEGATLVIETANDAGTRIIERYRRVPDGGLLLDLELASPLFEAPVETQVPFVPWGTGDVP